MFRYLIAILPAAMMANTALTTTYTTTAPITSAVAWTQTATQAAVQASQIAQLAADLAQTVSTTANNSFAATTLAQLPTDYTTRATQIKFLASALFNTAQTSALSPNVVRLAEATLRTTAALNTAAHALSATQATSAASNVTAQQFAQTAVELSTLAAQTSRAIADSTVGTTQTSSLTSTYSTEPTSTYGTAPTSTYGTAPTSTCSTALNAANQAQIASTIAARTLPTTYTQTTLSPSLSREVRQLVNATIRTNPSIIVDTISSYNSGSTSTNQAQALVRARSSEIFAENNQLVLGNPNGDVTIVEFNDYNCTYCKQMTATINRATQLDPNLRVLVKEAPVATPSSALAAKAAIAAKRQGQYASFRQYMTSANAPATPSLIAQTAQTLGLNQTAFNADLSNPAIDRYLARNIELARSLGFQATPTIIVSTNNGQHSQTISGTVSLNQLQSLVAAVRNTRTI
jgi:protein-disulfide isomerase